MRVLRFRHRMPSRFSELPAPERVRCKASKLANRNQVLVVDDDPGMLRAIERLLCPLGYTALLFSSAAGFEAHTDFENVACIILDINLGGASGIDLGRGLKEGGVSVPIIYITGNDGPGVRAAAEKSGCVAYLTKPFSVQSLIEPLNKASTTSR